MEAQEGWSCPTLSGWSSEEGRMCSGHNQAQQEEDKNQGEAAGRLGGQARMQWRGGGERVGSVEAGRAPLL